MDNVELLAASSDFTVAMYRALSVPDILREIFEKITDELTEYPRGGSDAAAVLRKTLAQAALTCHIFCSPALDALYKCLDSGIMPLLRLLTMFQLVDGSYMLTERLSCDDLTRFKIYASRVHEVTCHQPDLDPNVDSSVYFRLAQVCRPVLPNLRVLKLHTDIFPQPSEMRVFIAPSLSHVEMNFMEETAEENLRAFETFLDTLVDEIPHLRHLTLLSMPVNCRLSSVKDLKGLRSLTVSRLDLQDDVTTMGMVNLDMYRAFNGMKHLVELNINLQNARAVSAAPPLQLDSLKTISLTGVLPLITHIVGILSATHLMSFRAQATYSTTASNQYRSLLETLVRFPWLRRLNMVDDGTSDSCPLDIRDMAPSLTKLTQLEHFSLKVGHETPLAVNDEHISVIALALPKIRTFELYCPFHAREQAPKIGSLSSFARHCPMLVSLTLSVDEAADLPSDAQIFSHGLQILCIHSGDSLPRPSKTARFLDGLFPALLRIEDEKGVWKGVWDIIQSFQAIRKDQDRRMGYPRTGSGIAALNQLS